jgi:hypothetical protein
VLERG